MPGYADRWGETSEQRARAKGLIDGTEIDKVIVNDLSTTDSIVLPNTTNKGLKVGDADTSAFGWHDMIGQIEIRGVAATDPSWTQIDGGVLYAYSFGVGDFVWMTFHVPHDIVPGSDIHFHAHWMADGTSADTVKWEWTYSYAKGFDQAAFDTTGTVVTAEEAASGTAWQHMITETAAVTITGLTEPDGLIHCRVGRITNGGTENTDAIFMLTADIHYQSTGMATLNKAPTFYGT